MPTPTRIALILCALGLAGCSDGLSLNRDTPFAPGVSSRASDEAVDGLVVGHRLMAAGEYELALRAYYRAAFDTGLNSDVLSAVGSANLKLGRLGQAEENLRKAIELDETFVPAWNNLGVVLMERAQFAEAALIFQRAFALDSGESADIRENLRLALAKRADPAYIDEDKRGPALVRRGSGDYLLLTTP